MLFIMCYYCVVARLSGETPFDEGSTQQIPLFEQIEKGLYQFPSSNWANVSSCGLLIPHIRLLHSFV
jgi:hypothetical protein